MGDIAEVYLIKKRRAKKQHKCSECHGLINIDESYFYHSGVFDRSGFNYHICDGCESIRNELNKRMSSWDDPICVGEMIEVVFETNDALLVKQFLENIIKRGQTPKQWMIDRHADIVGRQK